MEVTHVGSKVVKHDVKSFDLSIIGAGGSHSFRLGRFFSHNIVSVQIEWESLTGTPDAVIQLQQQNDISLSEVDIPTLSHTINTTNGSKILENTEWGGEELILKISTNSVTGGTLKYVVIAKSK